MTIEKAIKNAIKALETVIMHPEVTNKRFVVGMYIDTQSSLEYGLEMTREDKKKCDR